MKITIESTGEIAAANGVPARVWKATAPAGTPLIVLVTRLGALPADPESEAARADREWLRSELLETPTRVQDPSGSVITAPRYCSTCLAANRNVGANYVARDADGFEWFECGDHSPTDNVAETVRTSLTPIDEWFDRANLPLPGGDAARAAVAQHRRRVAERVLAQATRLIESMSQRAIALETRLAAAETKPPGEPTWIEKDFHALYRAASEAHREPTSELRRVWLGAQIERLAPAFDHVEGARASAALAVEAGAERALARGAVFDVATELGVELARALRHNIDEVEDACTAAGIEHPEGPRPLIERDLIEDAAVRAILDDPRVSGPGTAESGGQFLAHALQGGQMAWHARAAHPGDVDRVRRVATPTDPDRATAWLFGFDTVIEQARRAADDPAAPPAEVQP